jgi:hypothetical protein
MKTLEELKELIGDTWFDITMSHDNSCLSLDTRDHGDVGEEKAGQEDWDEGERLLKILRKDHDALNYSITLEDVDEWVTLEMREYSKEEKANIRMKYATMERTKQIKAFTDELNKNALKGTNTGRSPIMVGSGYKLTDSWVTIEYGRRFLYNNHRCAEFAISEKEEAEYLAKEIQKEFPQFKWTVEPPKEGIKKLTGNYRPPNNVIEEYNQIQLTAKG